MRRGILQRSILGGPTSLGLCHFLVMAGQGSSTVSNMILLKLTLLMLILVAAVITSDSC